MTPGPVNDRAHFYSPCAEHAMKLMEFKEGHRTFTCRAESAAATPDTLWWWISVTGESQRYAAFRAEAGDTSPSLRPRVLAYYEQLLVDRARPVEVRSQWKKRAPAVAPEDAEAAATGEQADQAE